MRRDASRVTGWLTHTSGLETASARQAFSIPSPRLKSLGHPVLLAYVRRATAGLPSSAIGSGVAATFRQFTRAARHTTSHVTLYHASRLGRKVRCNAPYSNGNLVLFLCVLCASVVFFLVQSGGTWLGARCARPPATQIALHSQPSTGRAIRPARKPALKPASMLTTQTFEAQLLSIPSKAANPPNAAP